MSFIKDLSIKNKMVGLILTVTSLVVAGGIAIVTFNNVNALKRELINTTVLSARLVANFCVVPLTFRDVAAATETLEKLRTSPFVQNGLLYDNVGNLFAAFNRAEGFVVPSDLDRLDGPVFEGNYMLVQHRIIYDHRDYGTIVIRTSTVALRAKIHDTIYVMVGLALGLILFSYLLAVKLQSFISAPILHLAAVTKEISENADYSVRVHKQGSDEIGLLYDAFNAMLGQVRARSEERDHAHAAVQKSEEQYRALVEQASAGIFVADADGDFIDVNSSGCKILGRLREEILGLNIVVLMPESSRDHDGPNHLENLRAGQTGLWEHKLEHTDGQAICIEVSAKMLADGRLQAIVRDISKRKHAEEKLKSFAEELQRSNKDLENFAAVASHDLQEPLRKIQGFGDLLRRKYGDRLDEKGLGYLSRMQDASDRMRQLIADLLALSRVSTKGQPFVPVDLAEVTDGVLSDLEHRISESAATIRKKDLPVIEADPTQMRQLLQNLIGNALKFHKTSEDSVITISSSFPKKTNGKRMGQRDRAFCEILVSDNGIGFDEKYAGRIFDIFQRLHGRSEYEGTGVGLAICRKIAERHGGRIVAHGKPGKGATFSIRLPVKQ